ncbi:MAG: gliding motility-associated C-terminal domain-containing protein [Crocinitomicaceae bacterium]|nr:gliding motility-associated C-terminal domain-containing protein [Crocinitomicaceae bacterium]
MNDFSGCSWNDSIWIDVVICDDPVPNVFTRNDNGINDFFIIDEALLFPNNYLVVINRWGNVVFEASGYDISFRGEGLVDGTYFYQQGLDVHESLFTGFVTIIRN